MPHATPREDVQAAKAYAARRKIIKTPKDAALALRFGPLTWTERATVAVVQAIGARGLRPFAPDEVLLLYLLRRAARPRRRGPLRTGPPE